MTYEVGYGKPPKKNQFKKGQTGNNKGRPRVSTRDSSQSVNLLKMVSEVLYRKVDATERHKKIKIPYFKLLINKMLHDALHGDARAREHLIKLAEKADLAAQEGRAGESMTITIIGGLPDD